MPRKAKYLSSCLTGCINSTPVYLFLFLNYLLLGSFSLDGKSPHLGGFFCFGNVTHFWKRRVGTGVNWIFCNILLVCLSLSWGADVYF